MFTVGAELEFKGRGEWVSCIMRGLESVGRRGLEGKQPAGAVRASWALTWPTSATAFTSLQVLELRRPMDSRLEHVDFECLFTCLSVRQLIRIFASLLLERRVIFVADKLR